MARKTPILHDPIVDVFAEKLRQVRRARGMTQRDFARVVHLTESYVSRLEGGTISPGIDLVARISRALGISVTELLPSGDAAPEVSRAVAADQAKRYLETILLAKDSSFVYLLAQNLAIMAEAVERQR